MKISIFEILSDNITDYLKKHKMEIFVFSFWICMLNVYKISGHVIGLDTEQAMLDLNPSLNWTLGSGRFASAFFRKILMPMGFNYDMAVLYMIIGWVLICLTYGYCFERFCLSNRSINMLCGLIFCSNPIWVEQNYFLCSIFINVFGYWITIVSAYIFISSLDKKNLKTIFMSITLAVLAIGIYQALLYVLLANMIIFLLVKSNNSSSVQKFFSGVFKCVFIVMLSTIIYLIISKLCIYAFYDTSLDYAGHTMANAYISSRLLWGKEGLATCFGNIWRYFIHSNDYNSAYGMPLYTILFVLLVVFAVVKCVIVRNTKCLVSLIGIIGVFLCVFAGSIVMGDGVSAREQFVIPLFIAFAIMIFLYEIDRYLIKVSGIGKRGFIALVVSILVALIIFLSSRQLLLNRADYLRYMSDVSYANNIMGDIRKNCGKYDEKKIVFIGSHDWQLPSNYMMGELVGISVFGWDASGPVGINYRAYGMLNALGYTYLKASIEEIQSVFSICDKADLFKENKVIVYGDDYILVNLNEY